MWPMIWNCSCQTGNFTKSTCFSETWLRATYNNSPTGAIGCAMSSRDMPMGPSEQYGNAAAKLISDAKRPNQNYGALTYDTYLKVAVEDYNMAVEFSCMAIMGDPSLQVRTKAPSKLTVTHHTTDAAGTTSMTLQSPVEGAYISLTLNGKILGTGYISGGETTINFPAVSSNDQIIVTATAFNYSPYFGQDNIGTMTAVATIADRSISLDAYPSPTSGLLQVSFQTPGKSGYLLQVQNALGQLVYQENEASFSGIYKHSLDLSAYDKGVYFIHLTAGNEKAVQKVLVE
jgi:hypothetical protein